MGTCYIVGAGEFSEKITLTDGDFVIAADGGFDNLKKIGITPDLLIGDFDSISELPQGTEAVRYPVEKDETDSFLAYKLGVERGYREFVLLGGTGGRIDHTLANYSLMFYARREGNSLSVVGSGTRAYAVVNEKKTLVGKRGCVVSVFAFGGKAFSVSIKGLKYEADNITLQPEFALGVSNSYINDGEAYVSVGDGALLVIEEA